MKGQLFKFSLEPVVGQAGLLDLSSRTTGEQKKGSNVPDCFKNDHFLRWITLDKGEIGGRRSEV